MIIAYGSDLHFEFGGTGLVEAVSSVDADVLVLAGDIATEKDYSRMANLDSPKGKLLRDFFDAASANFKAVIVIAGNHEYYGSTLGKADSKIRSTLDSLYSNVHFLQNEIYEWEDVSFYGTTMWTPMADHNPVYRNDIHFGMNDFKRIRLGYNENYRKITPNDVAGLHRQSIRDYVEWSSKILQSRKVVLVQHHAPTKLSIADTFKGSRYNDAYYSEYLERILSYDEFGKLPDIIIHGHIHTQSSYDFNGVRVLANPRGYEKHEASADNFKFELEVI